MQDELVVLLKAPLELPLGIKLPFHVEDMAPKIEKPLLEIYCHAPLLLLLSSFSL